MDTVKDKMSFRGGMIASGNRLMLAGRCRDALDVYRQCIELAPEELQRAIRFNLNLAERKLGLKSANGDALLAQNVPKRMSTKIERSSVVGHLNTFNDSSTTLVGWAYKNGSSDPVCVLIYIDGVCVKELEASRFRKDLKDKKIGSGAHGYSMAIPLQYLDGRRHSVEVKEKATGVLCGKGEFAITPAVKYTDFDGMQRNNILDPMILAPFDENKKRCLAYMDVVEKSLSNYALKHEKNIKVSVLMAAYNRGDHILEAISSVLSQAYTNFELLIGDDGSADDTVTVASSISDPRIRVIAFEYNRGKSAVLNDLYVQAKGELIAYLDTDNSWEPGYLSAMVGAYYKTGAPVMYSAQYLYVGSESRPYAVRYAPFNRNLLFNRNYIDHNSFVHERSVFEGVGGYDAELRRCLDYDFIVKAACKYKMVSVPICQSNYFYEKASNSITSDKTLSGDVAKVCKDAQLKLLSSERAQADYLTDVRAHSPSKMTVVIPSYESLDDLKNCIGAIDRMDEKEDISLVIVDNDSSKPVKDYLAFLSERKDVKVILNDYNYGFTYAVNQGISLADQESDIILLNNDAIPVSGAFKLMSQFCKFKENVGAVVPAQILEPGTKTIEVHVPYARKNHYCDVNISVHHDNLSKIPLFSDGSYYEIKFAPYFCVYFPRSTIDSLGGLDAELGRHYRSDRLYSNQIVNYLEKPIYYLPDSLVVHKLQRSTGSLKREKNSDFDDMFKKNVWPSSKMEQLRFRRRAWFPD